MEFELNNIPILIVDDSDMDRYILKRHLQEIDMGENIVEKIDGHSALEFLSDFENGKALYGDEFPPVIIILDINMPKIDGFEFLEQFSILRTEVAVESCVVMMFTSSERQEDKDKAFRYNFVKDYLIKGEYSNQELLQKIQKMLPGR